MNWIWARGKLVLEVNATGALGTTIVGVEIDTGNWIGARGKLVREVTATWALGTTTVGVVVVVVDET